MALRLISSAMHPCICVRSIFLPKEDHSSNQKEVEAPLLNSTLTKDLARALNFSSFFQIQEPRELVSLMLQKEHFLIRYLLTHWTHRVDCEKIRHMSLRQKTLFGYERDRNPNPPSSFGLQTLSQEALRFVILIVGPDHKNDEQS